MADHTPNNDSASSRFEGSAKATSVPDKGFRIGEYVIEKSIGHGSMATVYLAHDSTGHEVALKIFQEGPGVSATMLERFRREAEASKKLRRHPNIMKVYATGQEGPYHYIVMEPVRNSRTLDDIIESSMLTTNQILDIVIKIASALHYAHTRNIVHRDVKPTNVMVDEFGEPLLTDFGVAALIDWPSCTITGALTGTPLYMSPEQARSERVGPESDIYSLAVVLYEALTEVLPYTAQHSSPVKKVLEAVKNEQPKRPRAHNKEISPDLEAVIMKALEKDPEDRYPDVQAFAHDLENAMAGRHVTAQLFSFRERIYFVCRKYDKAIAAAIAILLVIGGIAAHFHKQLISARYDTLISKASYRTIAAKPGSGQAASSGAISQQPGAWPEIRMARRAMNRGAWNSARTHLEAAIYLSKQIGDTRTTATAMLDLARIKSLDGAHEQAVSDYMDVLNNPDASPPVLNYAMIEALILTLLNDQRNDALQLLTHHNMPSDNIFKNAILCLSGDMSMDRYLEQITYLPRRLQNDAHLAAAVRYKMDGNTKGFAHELKKAVQSSMPVSEWPAPLAKRLYEETRK